MAVNELDDNDIAHLRRTAQKDFEEVDDKETLRIAYKFYMNKVRQRVEETTLASLVGPRAGAGAANQAQVQDRSGYSAGNPPYGIGIQHSAPYMSQQTPTSSAAPPILPSSTAGAAPLLNPQRARSAPTAAPATVVVDRTGNEVCLDEGPRQRIELGRRHESSGPVQASSGRHENSASAKRASFPPDGEMVSSQLSPVSSPGRHTHTHRPQHRGSLDTIASSSLGESSTESSHESVRDRESVLGA